jgi:aconitate hydratase 2/2-methylisocitrate dehydratase
MPNRAKPNRTKPNFVVLGYTQVDVVTHHTLPDFIRNRGGVSLKPGDGIIHSWLNRMLLPDTVGTGGDSHTRFPIGISFPAGSGLVAFGECSRVHST